ncbi:hypothetical protein EHR03_03400, partial [Leptospira mayottensis]
LESVPKLKTITPIPRDSDKIEWFWDGLLDKLFRKIIILSYIFTYFKKRIKSNSCSLTLL